MNKRKYCSPSLEIQKISLGEFCVDGGSCRNTKVASTENGNGTWAGTIRNINQAGYRTLRTIDDEYGVDYIVLS